MKNPLIWIVALVILLGLGWYFFMQPGASLPAGEEAGQPTDEELGLVADDFPEPVANDPEVTGVTDAVSAFTVRYTDNGFSPETMTVPVGTTVTWINQSSGEMWVGSDEHPSHTNYSGTSRSEHCPDTDNSNFDQCARGNTFSFTFTKAGSWDYHNHVGSEDRGTIIVE